MYNNIKDQIAEVNPLAIIWDGFDGALIGMTPEGKAVYDIALMTNILVKRDGMEEMEAREFLDFNVLGSYVGDYTPIHVTLLTRQIYHYDKQV